MEKKNDKCAQKKIKKKRPFAKIISRSTPALDVILVPVQVINKY